MDWVKGRRDYHMSIERRELGVECSFNPKADRVIVFLHGLACSRESFRYVFDHPYFNDMSLVLPDFMGFGKSDKPDDFSYSMEDQADLCGELLKHFPGRRICIVAHSMGNAVGLLLGSSLRNRLSGYACIEGNLIGEDCGLMSRAIAARSFDEYEAGEFRAQRDRFEGHPQLRFHETTPLAVHASARSLVRWSESGRLLAAFKALPCEKAYFWGERNRGLPVLQHLDGIRTYEIPRSGHSMMTENPEGFYEALARFMESV